LVVEVGVGDSLEVLEGRTVLPGAGGHGERSNEPSICFHRFCRGTENDYVKNEPAGRDGDVRARL